MRTIKFRGKDRRTGEWFYGNLYDKDTRGRTHICTTERGCLDIDPETVGQCTGLKDGKGNEIYEGDIVITYVVFTNEEEEQREFWRVGEIRYIAGGFSLTNCTNWDDCRMEEKSELQPSPKSKFSFPAYRSEVIGNIFDNPILIKNL